jgi:RNA polymerase sigma factor FliA
MEQHSENYTNSTRWPLGHSNNPIQCRPPNREHTLIEHLSTVRLVARSIHNRLPQQVDFNDLVNSGVLGLMDAFEKFDSKKCVQFGTFARFRIRGAILDDLRLLDWCPRRLRRKQRVVEHARHVLIGRHGRVPSDPEVAKELKIKLCEFQDLLDKINTSKVGSLNVPLSGDSGEDALANLPDRSEENPLTQCLRAEVQQCVFDAVDLLSERERLVVRLYYIEERTMSDIGLMLGIVGSRISQILSSAARHLKPALCNFCPIARKDHRLSRS